MARLFIGTLKGVAFDWFRSLPPGSINSWIDLETRFLSRFYEDDTEVTMDKLLSTVQRKGESVRDYIKRFRNLSLMCPAGMPLPMLLQTCRHNFLDQVEVRMGAVKAHTWKELVEQAEIAEKSAKKFEPSAPRSKWGANNKGRSDLPQSSQAKGKEIMSVELTGDMQSKAKKSGVNSQEPKFPPKQYSFRDDQVVTIFHLLHKGNKMKLPDARRPNEIGRTNDPKYCLYHRMIHHPTDKCYVLKDRIQALVDAGVLTLKTEQKKVTANMVTLEFGTAQKVTVPDGTYPAPMPRLKVKHPPAMTQNNKGLAPLTLDLEGLQQKGQVLQCRLCSARRW